MRSCVGKVALQSAAEVWPGASASGLAAYRATARRFEFAVSDAGRGVFASLQSCSDYSHLTDHSAAVDLMLKDGVSRYGKGTSHGNGFRDLFRGLANLNGELRFRSGDQAMTIDGINPRSIPATSSEKVPLVGFVASVTCSLWAPRRRFKEFQLAEY